MNEYKDIHLAVHSLHKRKNRMQNIGTAVVFAFIIIASATSVYISSIFEINAGWVTLGLVLVFCYIGINFIGSMFERLADKDAEWLIPQVISKEYPLPVLFEELLLQEVFHSQEDIIGILEFSKDEGELPSANFQEAKNVLEKLHLPLLNSQVPTKGINIYYPRGKHLWIVILSIAISLLSIWVLNTHPSKYSTLLLSTALFASFSALIYIGRIFRYRHRQYLLADAQGIYLGSKLLDWASILAITLQCHNERKRIIGKKYTMEISMSGDKNLIIPISHYQGGWYKIYRAIKVCAPIPVHIEVVEK